jgi:hypothetical protein
MSIESSPSGPLICTVDIACVLDDLPFADGSKILNVTPCGIVSGAEPILDWHGEVVVKFLGTDGLANAGNRKVGIESELLAVGLDAHCAHRRRAGANMLVMHVLVVLAESALVIRNPVIARHCPGATSSPDL